LSSCRSRSRLMWWKIKARVLAVTWHLGVVGRKSVGDHAAQLVVVDGNHRQKELPRVDVESGGDELQLSLLLVTRL
jgi:hypothetical protein